MPAEAIWIDMKTPSPGEDKAVEKLVGIEIPTREDMQEIEISSRLYTENGARYMTATLMCSRYRHAADDAGDIHPDRPSAGDRPLR